MKNLGYVVHDKKIHFYCIDVDKNEASENGVIHIHPTPQKGPNWYFFLFCFLYFSPLFRLLVRPSSKIELCLKSLCTPDLADARRKAGSFASSAQNTKPISLTIF